MNKKHAESAACKPLVPVLIRFSLYTMVMLVVFAGLPKAASVGDISLFKEGGPIESLQLVLLLLVSVTFLFAAWKYCQYRQLFCVLASLGAFAGVRELDSFFDDLLPFFGWQLPASIIAAAAAYCIWRNPRSFLQQVTDFLNNRGFPVLWAGFCTAVIFAQLVGHGSFLKMLMGDDYNRDYKRVIEELGEFFGYLLLFIGALESVLEARYMGNSRQKSCDSAKL